MSPIHLHFRQPKRTNLRSNGMTLKMSAVCGFSLFLPIEVIDVVARRFEMDMISKDGGYGRTNWCYTWNDNGKFTEKYRTRVIFKFSNDRKKVDIKTEAEFGGGTSWIRGFDTRLLSTIKQDISGAVGRTVM